MKYSSILPGLCIAWLSLIAVPALATDEDIFLGQIQSPSGQTVGHGRSAEWTLPLVATQYQPMQPTPAIRAAMQAQHEGRFLDALILLDEARRSAPANVDAVVEVNLLRASFLLQGYQSRQALEILAPLLGNPRYAADAYALAAMASLQQGQMQEALDAAQHAHGLDGSILPHLAHSYALQGAGRLAEAREEMRSFNMRTPQSAVTLAREAELALTLGQIQTARTLVEQAHEADATHPYVIAVSGLVYLIDGNAREATAAFETALQRDPKDAKALFGLGLAEIKLGNFQAGQEKLQAANDADPGNALILTYLGRSQQQSGQTEAARASWRGAQQADPKDPIPWLYQAQAQLQANQPMDARASLRQAQARAAFRSVYRGDRLLKEDEQVLQANLAEVQRQLGLDSLAFQTLSDSVGEKSSANLRNQAEVLQGQRFGESARRSLQLQSLFNDRPGNLPSELDVYGDGAGQTGATVPQHGSVTELGAQQASYNNYDGLFNQSVTLAADATAGSQNSKGEQIRLGAGSDTLGVSLVQRQFQTDGFSSFDNLDNQIAQGIVQWRPQQSTQAFVSYQTFRSQHGETMFPGDPGNAASHYMIGDNSQITRMGLRHSLTDSSEVRALWSHQLTDQIVDYFDYVTGASTGAGLGSSSAQGAELQYRASSTNHAVQLGLQQTRAQITISNSDNTRIAQQLYVAWQQVLGSHWQFDAQMSWGKIDNQDNTGAGSGTYLKRWLPKLGLVYTSDSGTHVRMAAWHGMGFAEIGDATLAPVSIAGILLGRTDDIQINGRLVHAIALSVDKQLNPSWLLDGQIQQRRTDDASHPLSSGQTLLRQQVDESRLALHWHPESKPLSVSLAYAYEGLQAPPYGENNSVQEQYLRAQQLFICWFASAQLTANLALSHNGVEGTLQTNWFSTLLPYQDSFNQVDASLRWQFNRRGSLDAGVRNAGDRHFQYTNIDTLNPRFSNGRLTYAKFRFVW